MRFLVKFWALFNFKPHTSHSPNIFIIPTGSHENVYYLHQTFYPCRIVIFGNLQLQSPNIPILHPFFNIQKIIANQKHHKIFSNFLGWYLFYPRTRLEAWFHWSPHRKREINQNFKEIHSHFQFFKLCHSIWHC